MNELVSKWTVGFAVGDTYEEATAYGKPSMSADWLVFLRKIDGLNLVTSAFPTAQVKFVEMVND
jgi:hypothetical protein